MKLCSFRVGLHWISLLYTSSHCYASHTTRYSFLSLFHTSPTSAPWVSEPLQTKDISLDAWYFLNAQLGASVPQAYVTQNKQKWKIFPKQHSTLFPSAPPPPNQSLPGPDLKDWVGIDWFQLALLEELNLPLYFLNKLHACSVCS